MADDILQAMQMFQQGLGDLGKGMQNFAEQKQLSKGAASIRQMSPESFKGDAAGQEAAASAWRAGDPRAGMAMMETAPDNFMAATSQYLDKAMKTTDPAIKAKYLNAAMQTYGMISALKSMGGKGGGSGGGSSTVPDPKKVTFNLSALDFGELGLSAKDVAPIYKKEEKQKDGSGEPTITTQPAKMTSGFDKWVYDTAVKGASVFSQAKGEAINFAAEKTGKVSQVKTAAQEYAERNAALDRSIINGLRKQGYGEAFDALTVDQQRDTIAPIRAKLTYEGLYNKNGEFNTAEITLPGILMKVNRGKADAEAVKKTNAGKEKKEVISISKDEIFGK